MYSYTYMLLNQIQIRVNIAWHINITIDRKNMIFEETGILLLLFSNLNAVESQK